MREAQPGRDLQPGGDVVRRGLLDPADADRRVHWRGRDADARGDARGRAPRPASTRRPPARCSARCGEVPQNEPTAVLPALARTASPRSTATSSRSTTASRYDLHASSGHPVQPRIAAPRAGVRHPQDHLARSARSSSGWSTTLHARQPRRRARLGLREGLRRGDVADASAGRAGGLRDRHRRGPFGAGLRRDRVRPGRHRARPSRGDRRVAEAPGRGRPSDRRRLEGQARARLGAADELRGADPADGRRRLRAAQRRRAGGAARSSPAHAQKPNRLQLSPRRDVP